VLAAEMDMQPPPFGGLFGGEVVVPQVSQVDRTARTHRNRSSRSGRANSLGSAMDLPDSIIEKLLVEGRGQLRGGERRSAV